MSNEKERGYMIFGDYEDMNRFSDTAGVPATGHYQPSGGNANQTANIIQASASGITAIGGLLGALGVGGGQQQQNFQQGPPPQQQQQQQPPRQSSFGIIIAIVAGLAIIAGIFYLVTKKK